MSEVQNIFHGTPHIKSFSHCFYLGRWGRVWGKGQGKKGKEGEKEKKLEVNLIDSR